MNSALYATLLGTPGESEISIEGLEAPAGASCSIAGAGRRLELGAGWRRHDDSTARLARSACAFDPDSRHGWLDLATKSRFNRAKEIYRWNFSVNLIDISFITLAFSIISRETITPLADQQS